MAATRDSVTAVPEIMAAVPSNVIAVPESGTCIMTVVLESASALQDSVFHYCYRHD
jgi:hypothetical protein